MSNAFKCLSVTKKMLCIPVVVMQKTYSIYGMYILHVPKGATKKPAADAKPKEKVWTKEDESAKKIQTKFRQYLAKKKLEKKKQEKQEYEDLMDKLEKEVLLLKWLIYVWDHEDIFESVTSFYKNIMLIHS